MGVEDPVEVLEEKHLGFFRHHAERTRIDVPSHLRRDHVARTLAELLHHRACAGRIIFDVLTKLLEIRPRLVPAIPRFAGRAYMKRLGLALAQPRSSSAVPGTCFTLSGMYSITGPAGQNTMQTPWFAARLCIALAPGRYMSSSFGSFDAYSEAIGIQSFWSTPADSASMPVSTPSISTRLASCCALIFPGSSGAGALE